MPRVEFSDLPDSARLWVFASDRELTAAERGRLLAAVDAFLDEWRAHGEPLRAAREWRDGRFLAIGVDQRDAHASGCSIDGLYRSLRDLERELGTRLLAGGRVFFRDDAGTISVGDRAEFAERAAADTMVFDTTVATAGEWRSRFEDVAARTWHASLLTTKTQS